MFVLIYTEVDGMAELNLVIPMRKGKKIEDKLVFYKEVVKITQKSWSGVKVNPGTHSFSDSGNC